MKKLLKKFFSYFLLILVFTIFQPHYFSLVQALTKEDCEKIERSEARAACLNNLPELDSQQLGCGPGFGPFASFLCDKGKDTEVGGIFNNFVSRILGFLTIIAALYFFFQFVTAGIAWVGAGGDKANVEAARSKIMNAIIGIVVVASAWVLVGIIGFFVGIPILNPGSIIDDLRLNPTPP
ncbi:hypothetical protein HY407_01230 [Candidatus Gottesmanbacteria bacterium]|nr:hypothetical protein [Candidatus Gottesmanbacteria bacterium]